MSRQYHILFIVIPFAVTFSQVRYFAPGKSGIGLNFAYAQSTQRTSPYATNVTKSSSIGFQGGYCIQGYIGFGVIVSRSSDVGTMYYGGFMEGALLKAKYFDINLSSSYQTGKADVEYYSVEPNTLLGSPIMHSYRQTVRIESFAASLEFNGNIIPVDYELQRAFGFGIVIGPSYLYERIRGAKAQEYVAISFGAEMKMYSGRITLILTPSYTTVLDPLRPKIISLGVSIADNLRK